jgi:hypothetical protein
MNMKTSWLSKGALVAACLPLFAGCVVYRDRPAPAAVVEAPAPPPPQTEYVTVAPGPLSVWFWAPGCWEWRGRWVWTGGHWIARPHAGAVWVGAHWDARGGRRVWVHGGWR